MDHGTDTAWRKWSAPECPYQVEYSLRVLDEIRLAVVDAFFSVPRGGAEIGGVLLGKHEDSLISINDFEALDCEHAMGPSFTLSARDQAQLAEMIARARRNAAHRQPVGWYHSHTRSEIFFSEADQDLHNRFFPEPWQVGLVLKPHTFEPMRAGFFFRELDGSIRGAASYQQFVLDAQPLRPAGGNHVAAPPKPAAVEPMPEPAPPPAPVVEMPKGRVPITREIAIEPGFGEAHEAAGGSVEEPAPAFVQLRQERSWRAIKAAALLALGLAAGGVGYQTREYWLPGLMAKVRAVMPKEPDNYLSLSVSDNNGQLKIQWDKNAPAVRNALEGSLQIIDGSNAPQIVRLNGEQMAGGTFSYARETERVDVTLIASQSSGQPVKEQTSFLGRLPAQKGTAAEAERAEKLQKEVNSQAAKTKKLEKDLQEMKRRLVDQSSEAPKKE